MSVVITLQQYTYNNQMLLLEHKKRGHNTNFIKDTYTYDVYGNILTKTISASSMANRTSSFEYENTGRFVKKSIDIEGLQTNYTYSNNGNLVTETNPYNLTTTYEYDIWGKQTKKIDYLGNVTNIIYSRSGSTGKSSVSVLKPDGSKTFQLFDPQGRIYYQRSYDFSEEWISKKTFYDIYDRVIQESEPSNSRNYQYNYYSFDEYARKTQTALFNGKTTSISYNSLETIATDGYKTVTSIKNAIGQIIELIDNGGTIHYEYYASGKLKQTNFDGNITTMEYDGWGKKIKLIDTSAGEYNYEYNNFGEKTKEITPNGQTTHTYSNVGKLTQKHVTGNGTDLLSNYHFDNSTKLLNSITTNQNTSYFYKYDNYKRLNKTIEQNNDFIYENSVTYDNLSRKNTERKKITFLLNNTVSDLETKNVYKNGSLWKKLNNYTQAVLWQLNTVNRRGQVTENVLGNNLKENNTYDNYGFIISISTQNNQNELIKLGYNFDSQRSLLMSRSNSLFDYNESFNYDDLNRLIRFTNINGEEESQIYDNKGRITHNSLGRYYYNYTKPYQASEIKLSSIGYDFYQERPSQQIFYNSFKAPVSITDDGHDRMYFYYNVFQQRAKTIYDRQPGVGYNKEKYFTYDGNVEIKKNNTTNETEILTYIGGDAYSAPVIYKSNGVINKFEYLHRDYQGTIIAVSSQQGNLIEKRAFDAWGNIAHITNEEDHSLDKLTVIDRGYTGHEHLENVALINMNARLYDAKLHRFLAPDNYIQDAYSTQNYNRYGYVLNNPLSYTDPSGEITVAAAALIGAGIAVLTNGVINSFNHEPFFQGVLRAGFNGFFMGAFANGIGFAAGSFTNVGNQIAFQTTAHAVLGGVMTHSSGGKFIHGFISGAAGSLFATATGNALSNVKNVYLHAGGMALAGGFGGGIASEISGGNFWDGFRNGLISAGLNHAAHTVYNTATTAITIKKMLIKHGYKAKGIPTYTHKYIKDMINKIPYLKEWYENGGSPDYDWTNKGNFKGEYFNGKVYFQALFLNSNYDLLSTAFHEFYHASQTYSGLTATLVKQYGQVTEFSLSRSILEVGAYSFQMSLGDTSVSSQLLKYQQRVNRSLSYFNN